MGSQDGPPRGRRGRGWPRRLASLAAVLLGLVAGLYGLDRALPPDLTRLQDQSWQVEARDGQLLRAFLSEDDTWRLPASPREVHPDYLRLLKVFEDRWFDLHAGVNPFALSRAAWQWARHGRIISGGSTLTMQVARLLEPRPRTVWAKAIEIARALQLERRFDKAEILSMYLTLAPYGGNLEGVQAASRVYLGKPPRHLTLAEAALLVALPQSPARLRPDRHPEAARAARDKVLRRARERGVIGSADFAEARAEAVPTQTHPWPFAAPHLARRLVQAQRSEGPAQRVRSCLDRDIQAQLEGLAGRSLSGLSPEASIAILALDNASAQVRGYVGSADFFAAARQGQVDMVDAVRSPGSALKPVIYGLAFEGGWLHPATLVDDRPRRFGRYAPRNFHGRFAGEVTAAVALQQSLNVPAIAILDRLGPRRFLARLEQAGIAVTLPGRGTAPTLAVGLGGVGIRASDLTALYAGLAAGGAVRPLVYRCPPRPSRAPDHARRLLAAQATDSVTRILQGAPPPPGFLPNPGLAYKTGTSYGFRDAWAVGYSSRWTVGVWVGRPDGTPSPGRYGRNTAGPVLFQAFDLIEPGLGIGRGRQAGGGGDADGGSPPALARLAGPAPARAGLRLAFPPDGAELQADGPDVVTFEAQGGARPLRWYLEGRPLPIHPFHRHLSVEIDAPGFYRITVQDSHGAVASANFRVRWPDRQRLSLTTPAATARPGVRAAGGLPQPGAASPPGRAPAQAQPE